jgi:hypothetical protein
MFKFVESRGGIPVRLPLGFPFPAQEVSTVNARLYIAMNLSLTKFLHRVSSTSVMRPNVLCCRIKGTNPPLCSSRKRGAASSSRLSQKSSSVGKTNSNPIDCCAGGTGALVVPASTVRIRLYIAMNVSL